MAIGDQVRRISLEDQVIFDSSGNLVGLQSGQSAGQPLRLGGPLTAAQVAALAPAVTSGVWRGFPSVTMRVRMTGAGTVSMDSSTGDLGAGTVTTAAYTATVAGTQIDDFAYPGDTARSIRFTLTGTAAVEVY